MDKRFSDSHFHSLLATNVDYTDVYDNLHCGIDIATKPDDTEKILPKISSYSNIYTTISAGPWCAKGIVENSELANKIEEIYRKANSKKIVAVGEIGLDYYQSSYAPCKIQQDLFVKEIEVAKSLSLPLILHVRDSFEDIYNIISNASLGFRNILHCFSSTVEWAKKFLDLNYYIAFGGSITYKSNEYLRQAVKYCPLDSMVVETDSPYLSPQGLRGRENSPLNLNFIISLIAKLKQIGEEKVIEQTNANLDNFILQSQG